MLRTGSRALPILVLLGGLILGGCSDAPDVIPPGPAAGTGGGSATAGTGGKGSSGTGGSSGKGGAGGAGGKGGASGSDSADDAGTDTDAASDAARED